LDYDQIVEVRKSDKYEELAKGAEGALIVICVLVFLIALSIFILFLCNLCCCKKNSDRTEGKAQCYLYFTLICFIVFFVFLILTMVYSTRVLDELDDVNCVIAKFPDDLLNGNTGEGFLGF
jgi:NADH:ubiquinone oxidoreductase subunit 6 (subunit J)